MNIYPLPTLVAVARSLSPFYRELYANLPADFQLADLPVVEQKPYWEANTVRNNRLLTGPLQDGIVFKSGGTTGDPKFSAFRKTEWQSFTEAFGEALEAGGLKDGERVANIFYAGELYSSFVFVMKSLDHARANCVQFPLSGRADFPMIAHTISDFDIDVLAGVPTTLVNLAEYLRSEGQTLPSLKRILFGGESLYPDQRDTLRQAFPNARAASVGYASVDAGLLGYADLSCGPDEHRAFDRYTHLEILDEETGQVIEEMGRPGKVVVTNLTRLLMPIIRYPAGDRAVWLEPAGTPDRKLKLLGRSEEGARVGPMTLYVEDVLHVLEPFHKELAIANFQMLVTHHDKRDQMTLRIVAHATPEALAQAAERVKSAIYACRPMYADLQQQQLVHPLQVEWVDASALVISPRTGKLKRVLDQRHGS